MPEVSGVLGNSWGLRATLCYVLAELAVENDLQNLHLLFTSGVTAAWLGSQGCLSR